MGRRSDQDAALDALYAQVPDIGCKGHCSPSCGPVPMSYRERSRIKQETGITIPTARKQLEAGGDMVCPALTDDKRCGAYRYRPILCRVWGASEGMPCQWGCTTTDGTPLMATAETYRLIGAVMDAGGGSPDYDIDRATVENILESHGEGAFETPAMTQYREISAAGDYVRADTQDVHATFAGSRPIKREAQGLAALDQYKRRGYA